MTSLDQALTKAYLRAANAAARAGDYELFLGAGASAGAVNSHGRLPLGRDLVKLLAKKYTSAPIAETDSLPRAYQRAVQVASMENVYHFLREIFLHVDHGEWFTELAGLTWRRAWTLNVDDAFERAYEKSGRYSYQGIRTISWDDPYSETGDLEVVHLHGHVHEPGPRRLVFSLTEYQAAARERHVWNQVLEGVLASRPVVALGARLLDDPDIESIFLSSRPTSLAPSLVVDPYISEGNEFELRHAGFIVLKTEAELFTKEWQEAFNLGPGEVNALFASTAIDLPQIQLLETNHVPLPPRNHDYLGGDEPLWSDVCHNRAALLRWMRETIAGIERWLDTDRRPEVHLVYAERLTGVSSGLLQVAREARRMHVEVAHFDKSSRLNVPRFLDFCRDRGPVLLLVDGAADFGDDIDRLAKAAAKETQVELFVLLADRPYNDLRIEGRLTGSYAKRASSVPRHMANSDARTLVEKLDSLGRLGALELATTGDRVAHFRGRDVFSALVDVEYAIGFRKRLEGEIEALAGTWKADLILLLGLSALSGSTVGVIEASLAVGVRADALSKAVDEDDHLGALVERIDERIVARQRDRSVEFLIARRGPGLALKSVAAMVTGMAPLATRQGLRERNWAAVLVSGLMGAKQLDRLFPHEDIDNFYDGLRSLFGDWNGRYWEQRAIYAKIRKDWAHAESFASRAVTLWDDAFTRTTLGTILINKADSLAADGDDSWATFYTRGRGEFEIALEKERGNRVTAFAFLEATLGLLGTVETQVTRGRLSGSTDEIAVAQADWTASYASLRVSLTPDVGFESTARAEKLSERFGHLRFGEEA